jgi:dipeptidase E
MGGGGFSMEPDNPLLDLYALKLCNNERPKVCFVATASGDAQGYIDRFYKAFKKHHCHPHHLSLTGSPREDLREFVLNMDLIYVGGGNTMNMLARWRQTGFDGVLKEAWKQGVVLAGISAGSICWFEQGVTDSIPGKLTALDCLGLLKGSNCPHYDGEAERRPAYQRLVAAREIQEGIACDDGVGLHFIDNDLSHLVSSRIGAKGWKLTLKNGQVEEAVMEPEYLG